MSVLIFSTGMTFSVSAHTPYSFSCPYDEPSIGVEEAATVAHMKLLQLGKSQSYLLGDVNTVEDEGTVLFYVFNLVPQGYLVVPAYEILPPVIAYSFTHTFQGKNSDENILLEMLCSDIHLRLTYCSQIPDYVIRNRQLLWDAFLQMDLEVIMNRDFQQWPPLDTTAYGGWIETSWNQNAPHNKFCPIDLASGARSVAGCPAVAMAQILNYHETTNNIVFNDSDDYYHNYGGNNYWIDNDHITYDFPSFLELNVYLDTLVNHYQNQISPTEDDIAALIFACGVAAKQVYNPSGSGTFGVNQAFQAYVRFGFENIELLGNNDPELYNRMQADIKNSLPVHLAVVNDDWTAGHNLVVDGYNTDDYYHLNFGWGGSYDGWYLLPEEIPYELTVIEGVIVNITDNYDGSDLKGNGALNWYNVKRGSTVTDNFTIENIGAPSSGIDWEVVSWPSWGTWTFTPSSGDNLQPEDGPVTIEVSVIVPKNRNTHLSGHITIASRDNPKDFCLIHVSCATPRNFGDGSLFLRFFQQHPHIFPIIRHLLGC